MLMPKGSRPKNDAHSFLAESKQMQASKKTAVQAQRAEEKQDQGRWEQQQRHLQRPQGHNQPIQNNEQGPAQAGYPKKPTESGWMDQEGQVPSAQSYQEPGTREKGKHPNTGETAGEAIQHTPESHGVGEEVLPAVLEQKDNPQEARPQTEEREQEGTSSKKKWFASGIKRMRRSMRRLAWRHPVRRR